MISIYRGASGPSVRTTVPVVAGANPVPLIIPSQSSRGASQAARVTEARISTVLVENDTYIIALGRFSSRLLDPAPEESARRSGLTLRQARTQTREAAAKLHKDRLWAVRAEAALERALGWDED